MSKKNCIIHEFVNRTSECIILNFSWIMQSYSSTGQFREALICGEYMWQLEPTHEKWLRDGFCQCIIASLMAASNQTLWSHGIYLPAFCTRFCPLFNHNAKNTTRVSSSYDINDDYVYDNSHKPIRQHFRCASLHGHTFLLMLALASATYLFHMLPTSLVPPHMLSQNIARDIFSAEEATKTKMKLCRYR